MRRNWTIVLPAEGCSIYIKIWDTVIFYDVISMYIKLCCRADPCRKPQFAVVHSLSLFAPLPQSLGFLCPLPSLVLTFPKLCVKICDTSIKLLPPVGWCALARGEDRHYFLATTATNVLTFLLLCLSIGSLRKVWNPLPNATLYLTAVAPYPDELHFLKCTGLSREGSCEFLEENPVWTKVARNAASFEVRAFTLMKIQIF